MNAYMKQQLSQYQEINNDKARLLVSCPDQPGIVAAVSSFYLKMARILLNRASIRQTLKEAGSFCGLSLKPKASAKRSNR